MTLAPLYRTAWASATGSWIQQGSAVGWPRELGATGYHHAPLRATRNTDVQKQCVTAPTFTGGKGAKNPTMSKAYCVDATDSTVTRYPQFGVVQVFKAESSVPIGVFARAMTHRAL